MGVKRSMFGMLAALAALSACATPQSAPRAPAPVEVKIIAFNDFHGALEPPRMSVPATTDAGTVQVPAGGAAYFATAVRALRDANPNHVVVAAGDLISASPLVSAQFLDEPTILAMNMIGLDFNALGNHEFDRGREELLRMQHGGCERHTALQPCRIDADFPGASFGFLAANVRTEDGNTLFPAYAIRRFGSGAGEVAVGIIGLPLKETPAHVTPAGVAGLTFDDEADSINALIPRLRSEGADAIVVVIHQGVSTEAGYEDRTCRGMDGELMPILARLDPAVDLVVSGHTHNAYICDYGRLDPARPFLVTSAGRSGTMLTDITLTIDPVAGRVVSRRAEPVIVQGEGYRGSAGEVALTDARPRFAADAPVGALVRRYAAAAAPIAARTVGRLAGPAPRGPNDAGESTLGYLIADAQLAATRAAEAGGARIAFMNIGGVRTDLIPGADGGISYGQIFAVQPFGNGLVVKTMTGAQIRALLEQQFVAPNGGDRPAILMPSHGFTYSYDMTRPQGQRIVSVSFDDAPLRDDASYRVTMNSFLATGGDGLTLFREGTDAVGGAQDVDALEAYLSGTARIAPPAGGRVTRLDRR
ncbi:MAG: bifunctional metallophosphatase/5'-nucleotidase [Sphingomonas sp.]|nr:bifunctional metallophosphatase/5'-nucleotidase [Sphingomonas sp.]